MVQFCSVRRTKAVIITLNRNLHVLGFLRYFSSLSLQILIEAWNFEPKFWKIKECSIWKRQVTFRTVRFWSAQYSPFASTWCSRFCSTHETMKLCVAFFKTPWILMKCFFDCCVCCEFQKRGKLSKKREQRPNFE